MNTQTLEIVYPKNLGLGPALALASQNLYTATGTRTGGGTFVRLGGWRYHVKLVGSTLTIIELPEETDD